MGRGTSIHFPLFHFVAVHHQLALFRSMTAPNDCGLEVSDVDSTSWTTTLQVEHGTLNVAAIGGATVVGSGSSTVTLTGNAAEIDAVLGAANNVLYHSAFDFNGIDHLTMTTSDDGSLSDIDVLDVQVAPAIAACTFNGITRPALNL